MDQFVIVLTSDGAIGRRFWTGSDASGELLTFDIEHAKRFDSRSDAFVAWNESVARECLPYWEADLLEVRS